MDLSKIKDIKDLRALLDLMSQYDLAELELTEEGRTLRFRKAEALAPRLVAAEAAMTSGPMAAASRAQESTGGQEQLPANVREVTSPMVGSFYRAPSPEVEPFVREGDRVQEDTVLCIIEAMKVMNEIPAGVAGIVREALVKNGESVEYGQPLYRVEVE